MTSARSFILARWLVAALVVCTALLTVSGIAAQYFDLGPDWNTRLEMACATSFAGIAVFALATSQVAASMAQTLSKSAEHRIAFRMAIGCTLVTAAISVGGAHMGAIVLGLDPFLVDAAGLCLAFVKPCMSFVSEACAEIARAEALAEKHREQDGEWALRRHALDQTPRVEAPANDARPALPRHANQRAAAREMRRALERAEPKRRQFEGARVEERAAASLPPLSAEDIRAACAAIACRALDQRQRGEPCEVISIRSVAREIGCDAGRIKRHPERKAIFAAPDFAHAAAA